MSKSKINAPENEQLICLECGFCCDGTLFLRATIKRDEAGHLPEKIEESKIFENGKELFRLPCNYFSGKCTIYRNQRAKICGSYRCQLLKDLKKGELTSPEAVEIIRKALNTRRELLDKYQASSGRTDVTNFRQLLIELGKILNSEGETISSGSEFEILQTRCNIFEALLIKHFRSADDFDKLMQ